MPTSLPVRHGAISIGRLAALGIKTSQSLVSQFGSSRNHPVRGTRNRAGESGSAAEWSDDRGRRSICSRNGKAGAYSQVV